MATINTSSMFFNQPGPALGDDSSFMSFNGDSDEPTTIDPQLTMPHFDGLVDEKASDPFLMNASFWDTSMTGQSPMAFFGGDESIPSAPELDLGSPSDNDHLDSPSTTDTNISQPASEKSHTSSKSSATSVSSGPSSQERKRTRRPTEKAKQQLEQNVHQHTGQQQSIQSPASQSQTAPQKSRHQKRSRQTKQQAKQPRQSKQKEVQEAKEAQEAQEDHEDDEIDPKRSKFLERNRLAASKCRQKKKQWMHDLEDTKSEMEKMHATLHREYNLLLSEVSEMKTQLMLHSGCHDHNIDRWIEMEAARFVQRSTNTPSDLPQLSGSEAASRRPSHSSTSAPLSLLSPTLSVKTESFTPKIKEEINYDHMPDDMFE